MGTTKEASQMSTRTALSFEDVILTLWWMGWQIAQYRSRLMDDKISNEAVAEYLPRTIAPSIKEPFQEHIGTKPFVITEMIRGIVTTVTRRSAIAKFWINTLQLLLRFVVLLITSRTRPLPREPPIAKILHRETATTISVVVSEKSWHKVVLESPSRELVLIKSLFPQSLFPKEWWFPRIVELNSITARFWKKLAIKFAACTLEKNLSWKCKTVKATAMHKVIQFKPIHHRSSGRSEIILLVKWPDLFNARNRAH